MKTVILLALIFIGLSGFNDVDDEILKHGTECSESLVITGLRITSGSSSVSCGQSNSIYRIKFRATGSSATCACVEILNQPGSKTSYFSNPLGGTTQRACIDTNRFSDASVRFHFGGDPIVVTALEGCNPPVRNGSRVTGSYQRVNFSECGGSGGVPGLGE